MSEIRVHVEQVTVRGVAVPAPERFAAVLAAELERLVADGGLPVALSGAERVGAPAVPASTGDAFARRVAAAAYRGLCR